MSNSFKEKIKKEYDIYVKEWEEKNKDFIYPCSGCYVSFGEYYDIQKHILAYHKAIEQAKKV